MTQFPRNLILVERHLQSYLPSKQTSSHKLLCSSFQQDYPKRYWAFYSRANRKLFPGPVYVTSERMHQWHLSGNLDNYICSGVVKFWHSALGLLPENLGFRNEREGERLLTFKNVFSSRILGLYSGILDQRYIENVLIVLLLKFLFFCV